MRMWASLLVVVAGLTMAQQYKEQQEEQREVPVITTLLGRISGVKEESRNGKTFHAYYGIPFAKPPVGELRFKDPVASEGWQGVREGKSHASSCPQVDMLKNMMGGELSPVGSEDCLYLDVFTPQTVKVGEGLPVLVSIHGGGFIAGDGKMGSPHYLMNNDVVVDEVIPGNFGLKDQTLALRWVHDNIHTFGGDPNKVAIFGVSAGGASVHYQVLTPHSKGLFSRAIMQSGAALCPWARGGAHREVAQYVGRVSGCPDLYNTRAFLQCLQEWVFFVHQAGWMHPFLFGPRVDGDFLPDDPRQMLKDGRHQDVDIISGVMRHDGSLMTHNIFFNEAALAGYNANFSVVAPISLEFEAGDVDIASQTKRIFEYYLGGSTVTVDNAAAITEMMTDRHFRLPHEETTEHLARTLPAHNKVFSYLFNHRGQFSLGDMNKDRVVGMNWVGHGDDLFYIYKFAMLFPPLERDDDIRLSDIIIKMWINFAATGNPTPDDSLGFRWGPFSEHNNQHLELTVEPTMTRYSRHQVREFWSSLPLLENVILHPEKVSRLAHHWLRATQGERQSFTATKGTLFPGHSDDLPLRKPVKVALRDEL
ncbi:Venom carboxylesterase-6-like 1 [Homarus americanus]|uniref:Carboxylic ester hydrolase n=1 Tax=Homarus americanus TaxID=6706 RepID=A0A8J5JYN1_HOMAM|nr:Venom carboxylesterase-6-like 1 [Homarus americanus]